MIKMHNIHPVFPPSHINIYSQDIVKSLYFVKKNHRTGTQPRAGGRKEDPCTTRLTGSLGWSFLSPILDFPLSHTYTYICQDIVKSLYCKKNYRTGTQPRAGGRKEDLCTTKLTGSLGWWRSAAEDGGGRTYLTWAFG